MIKLSPQDMILRRIVASNDFSVALDHSGTVFAWGRNTYGEIPKCYEFKTGHPIQVLESAQLVTLSSRGNHTLALDNTGQAFAWGVECAYQLGYNSRDNISFKVDTDVAFAAIAAGVDHSLALTPEGKLYGWGNNDLGQLACPSLKNCIPTATAAETTLIFSAISAGCYYSLALTPAGQLYGWGCNDDKTLDATAFQWNVPTAIAPDLRFGRISAGFRHAVALTVDGQAYAWGYNNCGQLGLGHTEPVSTPTAVATTVRFVAIEAGEYHTIALTADGQLYAWGYNKFGQIGQGNSIDSAVPLPIVVDGVAFKYISAGRHHNFAISTDDLVYGWGSNMWGAFAVGTTTGRRTKPTQLVPEIFTGAPLPDSSTFIGRQLSTLSQAPQTSAPLPAQDIPLLYHATEPTIAHKGTTLMSSFYYSVALDAVGQLFIWGTNTEGSFGNGTYTSRYVPVPTAFGLHFASVQISSDYILGLTPNGQLFAWGNDILSTSLNSTTPLNIATDLRLTQIQLHNNVYILAQTADETWCELRTTNTDGVLSCTSQEIVTQIPFSYLTKFKNLYFGISQDHQLYYWGHGELYIPEKILDVPEATLFYPEDQFSAIFFFSYSFIALSTQGQIYILGTLNYVDYIPKNKYITTLTAIATDIRFKSLGQHSYNSIYAISTEDKLYRLHLNDQHDLCIDIVWPHLSFAEISPDSDTILFKTTDGQLYGYGNNENGQLGNGVVNKTPLEELTPILTSLRF